MTKTCWLITAAIVATVEIPSAGAGEKTSLGTLRVAIDGFRNGNGSARVAVFDRAQGFPEDASTALRTAVVEIREGRVQIQFEGLPPGEYAVSFFHDENDDGKLNKKLFGAPKEGYGVSNNVVHKLRPPRFEEAAFRFEDESGEVNIRVHY